MNPEPGTRDLRGLAGSIRRLFQEDPPADSLAMAAGRADPTGEGPLGAEAAPRDPGDVTAMDPLIEAVRRYIRAASGERPGARAFVEAAFLEARERRVWDTLADAVEALALFAEVEADAPALARDFVSPAVATVLVERVSGAAQDEGRRAELTEILPRLGPEVEEALLEALRREARDPGADRSVRRALLAVVGAMADTGSDILLRMLEDADWRVVRNGIYILGDGSGGEALPLLRPAVAHEDARVRREALSALARIGGDEAGVLAKVCLEDPDPRVRALAARTVGALHVELALRPLLAVLEAESEEPVVVEVVRSLGLLGDAAAVPALERLAAPSLFARTPQEVRLAAYRALAAIGTPHARSLILRATKDSSLEVRKLAVGLMD